MDSSSIVSSAKGPSSFGGATRAITSGMVISVDTGTVVRAAGGVVWKRGPGGTPQVALVHRPAYDDWSLPKGKLRQGEREDKAALREVREETGLRCKLERPLPSSEYRDGRGRPK